MDYCIEVFDTWGRRIATFDETPLLEAFRGAADEPDTIRGILPGRVTDLSPGYRVRVLVAGEPFCEAPITRVTPQWGDTRKLILEHYVTFHEVIEFEAVRPADNGNASISRAYANREISAIVKDAINSALGPVHYWVAHAAYPDGAEREYSKFLVRKTPENELEIGGIATGQWVSATRIDASSAYAKDGDTIAGLRVDGVAWPDLRLLMIDAEETALNSHAVTRHPEVADWTSAQYAASGYRLRADAAKNALQALLDSRGIAYVELNPHRNADGDFDDRVDAYGRYVGLVFGGGQCLNAAMIELGLADVYLYQDGRYHVPEMEIKDFFSYVGPHESSIETAAVLLTSLDFTGGLFELLTMLAYAAGGYVWSGDSELAVTFRNPLRSDRVFFFDPCDNALTIGSDSTSLANVIYFEGNPLLSSLKKTYLRAPSVDEYGYFARRLLLLSISREEDADKLAEGLLNDLAYPECVGSAEFFRGTSEFRVGDLVEWRDKDGDSLRRIERRVPGEWLDRFDGRLVARIRNITHTFTGKRVSTQLTFTSPLRNSNDPLSFIVHGQPGEDTLYQFRLDDSGVGVDLGYHLD